MIQLIYITQSFITPLPIYIVREMYSKRTERKKRQITNGKQESIVNAGVEYQQEGPNECHTFPRDGVGTDDSAAETTYSVQKFQFRILLREF